MVERPEIELNSIAIFRFSSLGDVVLATSFVTLLRHYLPSEISPKIYFFTFPEFAALLEGHPEIERVIVIPRHRGWAGPWKFYRDLRKNLQKYKVETVFDLQSSLRTQLVKNCFIMHWYTFSKERWKRSLLLWGRISLYGKRPKSLVQRYNEFLSKVFSRTVWEMPKTEPLTYAPLLSQSLNAVERFSLPSDYIVLLPSAAHAKKRWPLESFLQLSKRIIEQTNATLSVVVLGGKADTFCKSFEGNKGVINLAGQTSLSESVAILSKSQFVVGNDTGLMHLAEALRIPYLTLFGPTSEYYGFIPHTCYGKTLSLKIWCRPCSATGSGFCYRSHRFCLENISVDQVWSVVKLSLKS